MQTAISESRAKAMVCIIAVVIMLLAVAPAQATVTGYVLNETTNSVDWTTDMTGLGGVINTNVNFDAHPTGPLVPGFYLISDGVTLTGTAGADTVASGAGPGDGNNASPPLSPGEGLHSPSNHLVMGSPGADGSAANSLTISFATPVLGAGLFTIDRFGARDFINDMFLDAYTGPGGTGTLLGSFAAVYFNFQNNNQYFMGVISTAVDIESVVLRRTVDNTGDTIGVDDIRFASGRQGEPEQPGAVPEPTTILLLGSGLAGLVVWRRKKT